MDRIIGELGTRSAAGSGRSQRPVEQAQGALTMITAGGAKLIENAPLVRPTGALISAVDTDQGLPFGG